MRHVNETLIYLFIFNISLVCIYAYEHYKFMNNDNDLNEIVHENLIEKFYERAKRDVVVTSTLVDDGSATITLEPSTYTAVTSVTIQSTATTIEMSNRSTIGLITDQTSLLLSSTLISTTSAIINMSTTSATTSTSSLSCDPSTQIQFSNGSCLSKIDVQIYTVDLLRNRTNNDTVIATSLSLYITSITNTNISWNPYYILSPSEIDEYVSSLHNVILAINSTTSFIMVQQPNQLTNTTILGASYIRDIGGAIVDTSNQNTIINSNVTAAAIIHTESLVNVTFLSMFIIGNITTYENIDNSTNKTLASSIIIVSAQRNSSSSISMNISLYFQVLNDYKPTINAIYSCSFYDLNRSQWNESGCTTPVYNIIFTRYECSCNHLSTFALVWSPNITSCNASTQLLLSNGTCISKTDAQIDAVNTLRSNSTNSTGIADALSLYISAITNSNATLNSTYILTVNEMNTYLNSIGNQNLTRNTNDSFLMVQSPNQDDNVIVLGASFTRDIGGEVVKNTNKDNVTSSFLSTAAIIDDQDLIGVTSLNMLIIANPSLYRNIDNSTNKTLASSIIMASVKRNNSPSSTSMNISLYFQVLNQWKPNTTYVDYYCSFYDTNQLQWNESGCTRPQFNAPFNRYECSCNHLTSFALLWLPNVPLTRDLNAQDIASLVFESISIICFLFIIIHAVLIRFQDPLMVLSAYDLLPLMSSASTTILFIFHIALGMTVYTKTTSLDQTQCFLSSSVLMFFVYFFLIFMFCTKTSVGYFNYLRFVRLFPQPSHRKLFNMLIISFFTSIAWVAFAAGFNSNSSFSITQLYPYKLCWFTREVIYYFLTIPVCLFILINIIVLIFVGAHIIGHVRNATSPHHSYERMKRCVIVLLSSCLTQGIGWLFGPFLTFSNPTAGQVLGWFFVVFNGLEGVWSIILYIIICLKHMDEQKRVIAVRILEKSKTPKSYEYKNTLSNVINDNDNDERLPDDVENRNIEEQRENLFHDLRDLRSISWPGNENDNMVISYF